MAIGIGHGRRTMLMTAYQIDSLSILILGNPELSLQYIPRSKMEGTSECHFADK